jgi:flavin reductase (DIM6/NTAB) family NADH-FMN oxidoreductase RutF
MDGEGGGLAMHVLGPGFAPESDPRAFRHALGAFATGVAVVTTGTPEGPLGITANSFTSVSMEPPLVLWCPAKWSRRYAPFAQARHFAIHILGADQRDVAEGFSREGAAFAGLDWAPDAQGVPLIAGVLARFVCETWALHEAGDHAIVVGRVTEAARAAGPGLVFHGGVWGRFGG